MPERQSKVTIRREPLDLNLAEFISGHAAIMAGWRYDSGFVESAVALPQTLLSSGMTALAAREFRNLRTIAEAAEELELFTPDPELITHLFRDEAGALLAGGQADAAVDLLGGLAPGQGDDVETERLLIQALSQAGRAEELADWGGRAPEIGPRSGREGGVDGGSDKHSTGQTTHPGY